MSTTQYMDETSTNSVKPTSLSISSLLNNPNSNLTQTSSGRPSNRDIPLVHLSPVPAAAIGDFSNYIAAVGSEYDIYLSSKQYGLQQHLQANRSSRRPTGSIFSGTEGVEARLADQIPSSIADSSRLSFDETSSVFSAGPIGSPGSEANGFAFEGASQTPQIPAIFGDEDFELKNPRTFDIVTENISIVAPVADKPNGRGITGSSAQLQERFSNFMDIVETTLVDEISATGPAFFHALADLRELQSRANSCISRIDILREQFAKLSADSADVRIESAKRLQKRDSAQKLRNGLRKVQSLKSGYDKILQAEREKDAQASMKAMVQFQSILDTEPKLAKLQLVEQMLYNTDKIKYSLGQADIAAFKKILMQDLITEVQNCDVHDTESTLRHRHLRDKRILSDASKGSSIETNIDALRSDLERTLDSLFYTDQVETAFAEYKDSVIKEVKAITKRNLPAGEDDDIRSTISGQTNRTISDKSNILAKSLRMMTGENFNKMLRNIYMQTCVYVRRLSTQQKVLIDLISSSTSNCSISSQDSIYSSQLALTTVEICQARIVKLLNVRAGVNMDMTVSEMQIFYELNKIFNSECEALTGQFGTNLQSIITSQVKSFYDRLAVTLIQTIVATIEMDTWQPASLNERVQTTVDSLLDATVNNPIRWSEPLSSYQVTNDSLSGNLKSVAVQSKKFVMPLSAAALLAAIEQFLSLAQLLPTLRVECVNSTIELLRLFNSRSCQLILGAGATRSAGLERITAKHLAVTSQALAMVILLVPSFKAHLQRLCGTFSALAEFDKLLQLYEEHRAEIHDKLISIMEDRTIQICRQLAEWLALTPSTTTNGANDVSGYMTALVKVGMYKFF